MGKTNEEGITLIGLIIIIIILLILASISIVSLVGSGLFGKTEKAKQEQENAQIKEDIVLADYENKINQYIGGGRDITIEKIKEIVKQELQKEISQSNSNPTGTIISYMGNNAPEGYIFCDGAQYNISDYSDLAEQIKTEFGSYNYFGGDGTTTFAVPNLQGEFLRGYSTSSAASKTSGISTTKVGIHQNATEHIRVFTGSDYNATIMGKSNAVQNIDKNISVNSGGAWYNRGGTTSATNERYISRPTNTTVLYCIKY